MTSFATRWLQNDSSAHAETMLNRGRELDTIIQQNRVSQQPPFGKDHFEQNTPSQHVVELESRIQRAIAAHGRMIGSHRPDILAMQHELAKAYNANGQVEEAVQLLEHVVARQAEILAETHPSQLASQYELAILYHANGQVTEAVGLLQHIVTTEAKVLVENHPNRLATLHELARAYHAIGQANAAVELLEGVVAIYKKLLPEYHPNRLTSQHELARAYHTNGQVKTAITLLERIVSIQAKMLPEVHPDRLASQHELARAYYANGQVKEAVNLLELVVVIQAKVFPKSHPLRLSSQHELGRAYHASGRIEKALKLLQGVTAILVSKFPENHLPLLASQHELARALYANGQVQEAINLLEHVVAIHANVFTEEHPNRLMSQHELARAYRAIGTVNKAVELLEHVVAKRTDILTADHSDQLSSQHELARAYHTIGQVSKAVELLEHVVEIRKEVLAENHPNRLASQLELTRAYRAQGRLMEAVELLVHVVAIHSESLAVDHPLRLVSQHELATAYHENGQIKEAVELLEYVVAIQPQVFTEGHHFRLTSQHELARAYHANGQIKEAIDLLERVVVIQAQVLPRGHPLKLASRRALAIAYRAIGQIQEEIDLKTKPWERLEQRRRFKPISEPIDKVDLEVFIPELQVQPTISNLILRGVRDERLLGKISSTAICHATFNIQWDPKQFIREQFSGEEVSPADALRGAITLTGTATNAQALTSKQYLIQTWPSEAGVDVFQMLEDAMVSVNRKSSLEYYRPDNGTKLSLVLDYNELVVYATGPFDSVSEIGDLFAWLGAALRSAPRKHGLMYSIPFVSTLVLVPRDSTKFSLTCDIDFYFKDIENTPKSSNGRCWHNIFQNPVIVPYYPFGQSGTAMAGIDMPLEMMAALVGTHRITTFAGNTFLKSFNAMLILTQRAEGLSVWHFLFNEGKEHIAYTDPRVFKSCGRDVTGSPPYDLESTRHIIGWCSATQSFVGSPRAEYSIRWSRLEKPHQGCAFEKISISGGKIISASVSMVVGKKDRPAYISSRQNYIERLKWLEKKFVVLYDVGDRRAWLVDGVSTLTHLLRASLRADASSKFKHLLKFQEENMQEESSGLGGSYSAILFLTNPHNQNLALYDNPDEAYEETTFGRVQHDHVTKQRKTSFRLKDRVDQIYHVLEQVITHQSHVDSEDGIGFRVKLTPRTQLEGFDFMDLATDEDPFWPRIHTLTTNSSGWVDLIRALHAVTLFGEGFGDLLRPVDGVAVCTPWTQVPEGRDYLTASSWDLKEILAKRGDNRKHPWRLIDDIYWLCPGKAFEPCQCSAESSSGVRSCDRIQILSTSSFTWLKARTLKSPSSLPESGAIIFGHNKSSKIQWADSRGQVIDNESLEDSGLGSSIGSPSDASIPNNAGHETSSADAQAPVKAKKRKLLSFLKQSK